MNNKIILECKAYEVAKQTSVSPLIFELPVSEGRRILEEAQSSYVFMCPSDILICNIDTIFYGNVKVYMVIPPKCSYIKNIIFYIHGAGWVFGSFHTHEKLVRELAYRTNSIVVFPEYTRSPEVKFPVAIEQCYSVLTQLPSILKYNNIIANLDKLTVAGDSVGGNMAIVMSLMSKFRNGPKIHKQLLYYPVTDDNFNTFSYIKFASGYYLYREGMKWFWNQYIPDIEKRSSIFASPLKASLEELDNMPDTMVINGEADVLRDEGEAYADKLRLAGNDVTSIRFRGMIHDFVMLNSLDNTNACRTAMDISTCWINSKNK